MFGVLVIVLGRYPIARGRLEATQAVKEFVEQEFP
jgi:hypothetical protein